MKNLKHFPPLEELHKNAALERQMAAVPVPSLDGRTGTSTPTLHDLVLGPRSEQARLFDHVLDNALAGQSAPGSTAELAVEGDEIEAADAIDTDDNDSDWADDESVDGNSGVRPLHRDWIEWSDKCRMLPSIPCVPRCGPPFVRVPRRLSTRSLTRRPTVPPHPTRFEHSWVLYVYQSKFVHAVCQEVETEKDGRHVDVRARVLDFSPYSVARLRAQGAEARTPTAAILYKPSALPELSATEADAGRLIAKPNLVPVGGVWANPLTTGAELPYVERETEALVQEGIRGQTERLDGLCLDEQRIVFVKRNRDGDVIFDVLFF